MRTDLYIIRNGNLTTVKYIDDIIKPLLLTHVGAICVTFILMDDNIENSLIKSFHKIALLRFYIDTVDLFIVHFVKFLVKNQQIFE